MVAQEMRHGDSTPALAMQQHLKDLGAAFRQCRCRARTDSIREGGLGNSRSPQRPAWNVAPHLTPWNSNSF